MKSKVKAAGEAAQEENEEGADNSEDDFDLDYS